MQTHWLIQIQRLAKQQIHIGRNRTLVVSLFVNSPTVKNITIEGIVNSL